MTDRLSFFFHRVRQLSNGCIEWTGWVDAKGYGYMRVADRKVRAHRWSYEQFVGPIPEGLVIDHLCRNPSCVNPAHMEPVTSRENTLRGVSPAAVRAQQTHCKRGHEFTPENTYIGTGRRRICRICKLDRQRERRRVAKPAVPSMRQGLAALGRTVAAVQAAHLVGEGAPNNGARGNP